MATPPALFDETLARNRLRRVTESGLFLQRAIAAAVQERLTEVNRAFTTPAIIGPQAALWAEALALSAPATRHPATETLPLSPGAHDLTLHALALHAMNDPVGQLIQCRRALAPDGLCLAVLFGGETLATLRHAFAEAEAEILGGVTPRTLPMADTRTLGGLLQRAGFALPVADSLAFPVSYPDTLALMRDLRAMGETNTLIARHRRGLTRACLAALEAAYRRRSVAPDGRILAIFEVVVLTGWAPHESQQQPLRPGSAQMRLADALTPPKDG